MIEVNTQTVVFLQSLALGFALGLLYDVFRVLRLAINHSSVAVFLEDMTFFAVCAALTFLFSLTAVSGHVRVFLVIGELLGGAVYFFSLGVLVMKISKAIIRFIKALLRLLYCIFIRPFVRVFRWLGRKIGKLEHFFCSKAKKVGAKAKYGLKRQSVLVYNLYIKRNIEREKNGRRKGGAPNAKSGSKGAKNRKSEVS